jgi:type II secretory pathway component GspD/PulD (secretin)
MNKFFKISISLFFLVSILFLNYTSALSEVTPQLPSSEQQTPLPQSQKMPLSVPQKNKISFNFDDADVFEVIRTVFGEILKVNYIIDPKVKGRVNLKTVVPIDKEDVLPLMKTILKQNGIGFVEEKGFYIIMPLTDVPGASPQVFVYPVQNSKAKDLAALLQQIFLGAKPAPKAPATKTPAQTPTPTPTVIETKGGEVLVSEGTRIFSDDVTNSLIILATPDDYAHIEETIKKIDIVPRQVLIEGLIARIDLTDKLNFGMQWVIQNDFTIKDFKPFNRDINISGPLQLNTPITSNFTFTALDAKGNIKLLLQSLASEGKANILAAPHILVSDNREARIQVGSQVPIATQTATTPTGTGNVVTGTITSTIQYKDIGIILKVKPQVNESGLVSLEISQEVSSLGDKVPIAGQEFQAINKTEATTNLVAQDGETIIIGGLIREDITKARAGIPFLYKIPIIGHLFGSTVNESTKNELIILLTPRVMKNIPEAGTITEDYLNRYKSSTKDEKIDSFIKKDKKIDSPIAPEEGSTEIESKNK